MVATSATRDASNAAEFTRGVVDVLGVEPEVLTGDEEARLSFAGATAEFGAMADPPSRPISCWTSAAARPSSCWVAIGESGANR